MQNDFGGKSYPYEGELQSDEKTMAMLAHILAILTWFIGPLIIYLVKKDQSPFVRKHAGEALAFSLAYTAIWVIIMILSCLLSCFGGFFLVLLTLPVWIVYLLYMVLAAVRANEGKIYEFPLTSSFVK